jgi:membrane-associated phospholipid phosphatase
MLNSLNAADRLSMLFISFLTFISIVFIPAPGAWTPLVLTYGLLAGGLWAVGRYRDRSRAKNAGFYLHVTFTVGMILILFNSLGELISHVRSRTYDQLLIEIDYALFGVHPTVWMERLISPALTALLQFAYVSYYFMPIALGVTLIARGRREAFEQALFGIVLCFYLSYIGYLLVPAVGPRFTLQELQTTSLQAGPFVSFIQETLNILERNKTDAFPSGHTAIAIVSLYYAGKLKEKMLFRMLLPTVLALIVSTVYLRYHYVIDVIAGIGLAIATVILAPLLERRFSNTAQTGNERHYSA